MQRTFIVGAPRSGTTLTQQILSSHPQIYSPPETHYFQFLLRTDLRRYIDNIFIPPRRYNKFIEFNKEHKILEIPSDLNRVPYNANIAVSNFVAIMDYNAELNNKPCWIEKTPAHVFYIDRIKKYCRDCVFIHILRKPKDILASLVDVGRKFPDKWPGYDNISHCIEVIESTYCNSLFYIDNNKHLFIEFDKILYDTESTVTKMLDFIDIKINKDQLQGMLNNNTSESISRNDEKWKTGYGNGINSSHGSKYNEIFTRDEKEYITYHLRESEVYYAKLNK